VADREGAAHCKKVRLILELFQKIAIVFKGSLFSGNGVRLRTALQEKAVRGG
jgi:hypothetical protein